MYEKERVFQHQLAGDQLCNSNMRLSVVVQCSSYNGPRRGGPATFIQLHTDTRLTEAATMSSKRQAVVKIANTPDCEWCFAIYCAWARPRALLEAASGKAVFPSVVCHFCLLRKLIRNIDQYRLQTRILMNTIPTSLSPRTTLLHHTERAPGRTQQIQVHVNHTDLESTHPSTRSSNILCEEESPKAEVTGFPNSDNNLHQVEHTQTCEGPEGLLSIRQHISLDKCHGAGHAAMPCAARSQHVQALVGNWKIPPPRSFGFSWAIFSTARVIGDFSS